MRQEMVARAQRSRPSLTRTWWHFQSPKFLIVLLNNHVIAWLARAARQPRLFFQVVTCTVTTKWFKAILSMELLKYVVYCIHLTSYNEE